MLTFVAFTFVAFAFVVFTSDAFTSTSSLQPRCAKMRRLLNCCHAAEPHRAKRNRAIRAQAPRIDVRRHRGPRPAAVMSSHLTVRCQRQRLSFIDRGAKCSAAP
jgi:hypothetical protein